MPCKNGNLSYKPFLIAYILSSSHFLAFSIALSNNSSVVNYNSLPKVRHLYPKKLTKSTDVKFYCNNPNLI